ncbi:electron transfer flavoprotein, alpha subunit [Mycobacteroides abscessus M94]|nr:electron transfer flavoprotein, alpha subunit [Mycobacteroides abscessus M94]
MAEVLVLVEHSEGALKKVSAELITAARVLGEPSAVVAGPLPVPPVPPRR